MKSALYLALGFITLLSCTAPAIAQENTEPAVTVQMGTLRVNVLLGNMVTQPADALVVSHWPDGTNDGGGVGGAIASSENGRQSLKIFDAILKTEGNMKYTTVIPTPLSEGKIKAQALLNVIELRPRHRLEFNTVEELESSTHSFTEQTLKKYHRLLRTKNPKSSDFIYERNQILEPYAKQIGFETVVQTTFNVLAKAQELGDLRTINFPTLGYGIMGDLSIVESVNAILSGINWYVIENGAPISTKEINIVVYSKNDAKNRSFLKTKIGKPATKRAAHLRMAKQLLPRWENRFSRDAIKETPNLRLARVSAPAPKERGGWLSRILKKCSKWFSGE